MRLIDADALKEAVNDKKVVGRFNTIQLIDNAPTVEYPEQVTIKCDTEEDKQKLLSILRNVKLKAIVEDERPQGEWIPTSERLPEEDEAVLVWCSEYKNIYCAYFDYRRWWVFGSHGVILSDIVTAWKPLPKAPKEA